MPNLYLRCLTALIFGGLVLWMTWLGGTVFTVFVWCIGAAVLYEWQCLAVKHYSLKSQLASWLFYLVVGYMLIDQCFVALILVAVLLFAMVLLLLSRLDSIWVCCGFLYASAPAVTMALLRGDEYIGLVTVVFLYAVVWGTDIGAYFSGRALGGAKLAPRFSPNKTWSGAIGGAIIGVCSGLLVVYFMVNAHPPYIFIAFLALALSAVAQLGDIGESSMKRHFGVKDSGNLLPGHGGFMDRIDGLVCAAVLLYVIGLIVSGFQLPSHLLGFV